MERNLNFMPTVHCPHCGKVAHPEISGWGGKLSTRTKCCRFCGREYRLVVYAFVDTEVGITTCQVNNHKDRIEFLKQRIREKLNKVINKEAEWAEEFIRVDASTGGKQN